MVDVPKRSIPKRARLIREFWRVKQFYLERRRVQWAKSTLSMLLQWWDFNSQAKVVQGLSLHLNVISQSRILHKQSICLCLKLVIIKSNNYHRISQKAPKLFQDNSILQWFQASQMVSVFFNLKWASKIDSCIRVELIPSTQNWTHKWTQTRFNQIILTLQFLKSKV